MDPQSLVPLIVLAPLAGSIVAGLFGRRIGDGPILDRAVSLALTPIDLPSIEIRDIDDIGPVRASTRAVARTGLSIERALELYRQQSLQLIEDTEGVENLDSILKVPGIGAIAFGPYDYSFSSGLSQ